ncbi:MAG TPA: hypothetical protein VGC84_05725, partial [Ilumatobacteraceae bacterium]
MSINAESPSCTPHTHSITGSAALARSWFGQVRSAFGKPRIQLMSDSRPTATQPGPPPISSLLGTIPSLRFATPARLRELAEVTQREAINAGETIVRQGEDGDDVF